MLGLTILLVTPVLADGTVLRSFDAPISYAKNVKPLPNYWPIGIAFDGTNLWISQPDNGTSADIFRITTSGVVLQTLSVVPNAGALAWDGANLWVGSFGTSRAFLYQISVTGILLKTVDITSIYAADNASVATDGLDFDMATGTLWVSPDPGFNGCRAGVGLIYNIDVSGKLLARIQTPFGVSGVAMVGKDLYVVHRCSTSSINDVSIIHMTTKGRIISSFPIAKLQSLMWAEDISFDTATFAPVCALWAMQPYPATITSADLVAYRIACP